MKQYTNIFSIATIDHRSSLSFTNKIEKTLKEFMTIQQVFIILCTQELLGRFLFQIIEMTDQSCVSVVKLILVVLILRKVKALSWKNNID